MKTHNKPKTIKQQLIEHYTGFDQQIFQRFRLGGALFFVGAVIFYIASAQLQPSLLQESVILMALLIGGGGFLLAMSAQLRLLIGRLVRFWLS